MLTVTVRYHRIIKVRKDLYDHQVQPLTQPCSPGMISFPAIIFFFLLRFYFQEKQFLGLMIYSKHIVVEGSELEKVCNICDHTDKNTSLYLKCEKSQEENN